MSSPARPKASIRLRLLPQTSWGWRSVGLLLAAVLLLLATIFVVQVVDQPDYAGLTAFPSTLAAVGGGVTAAIAVLRHHERGALVLIALIAGLLLVVFVIGETISPSDSG